MAADSTQVAQPYVNLWYPNAIPPIDPSDPHIVHPTGEFGPESYIDMGAYSPVKFPRLRRLSKVRCKKDNNGEKGKKKPSLKLDCSKIKKGMT